MYLKIVWIVKKKTKRPFFPWKIQSCPLKYLVLSPQTRLETLPTSPSKYLLLVSRRRATKCSDGRENDAACWLKWPRTAVSGLATLTPRFHATADPSTSVTRHVFYKCLRKRSVPTFYSFNIVIWYIVIVKISVISTVYLMLQQNTYEEVQVPFSNTFHKYVALYSVLQFNRHPPKYRPFQKLRSRRDQKKVNFLHLLMLQKPDSGALVKAVDNTGFRRGFALQWPCNKWLNYPRYQQTCILWLTPCCHTQSHTRTHSSVHWPKISEVTALSAEALNFSSLFHLD